MYSLCLYLYRPMCMCNIAWSVLQSLSDGGRQALFCGRGSGGGGGEVHVTKVYPQTNPRGSPQPMFAPSSPQSNHLLTSSSVNLILSSSGRFTDASPAKPWTTAMATNTNNKVASLQCMLCRY